MKLCGLNREEMKVWRKEEREKSTREVESRVQERQLCRRRS